MRRHLLICLFVFSYAFGYSQVVEDFSDGELDADPIWARSAEALWVVNNGELQSNSSEAATYWISTSSDAINEAEWEFTIKLFFGTSGANYVDAFLTSDELVLDNTQNGYFVRIGDTQDEIVLYKIENGVETLLIDNTEGLVNSSSNNQFRIRVTKDENNLWTLFYDDELTGTYVEAGSIIDDSINASSYFGFLIVQSGAASPVNNHFFDDILANGNAFVDSEPPSVESVELVEPNKLLVRYNEPVTGESAEQPINYNLNNDFNTPVAVEIVDDLTVLLSFDRDFISGDYELTISSVSDLANNIISEQTVSFQLFIPDVPLRKDVIITEIFADPTPSVGLPEADFIEIYNNSDKTFDLANWLITDNVVASELPHFTLEPFQYLILTSNSSSEDFGEFGESLGVTSFSNFNNAGDKVALYYSDSTLIDQVSYEVSWYGNDEKEAGGYSLELINPNNICGLENNWSASEADIGGTPGLVNSIFDDNPSNEELSITEIRALGASQLRVILSEPLDTTSLSLSNFDINNDIEIESFAVNGVEIYLFIRSVFDPTISYTFTLISASNCTGELAANLSAEFQYVVNTELNFGDVIFTEIMANPNDETSTPNAEYLEIYNRSDHAINLEGLIIGDLTRENRLPFFILNPDTYAVVTNTETASLFAVDTPIIPVESFISLNNSGDVITLKTAEATLLDSVAYNPSWYKSSIKDDGGFSLELIDINDFCSGEDNWIASESETGGTPGERNSVFSNMPDNIAPEIVSAFGISSDTIQLVFNEILDDSSLVIENFEIQPTIIIEEIISQDLKTVNLILSSETPLQGNVKYKLILNGIKDCPGNLLASIEIDLFLIEEGMLGDVLLNEILFNPRPGGVDFVELYNHSEKYINLKNWQLANGELTVADTIIETTRVISEVDLIIPPREYKVFTSDALILGNQFPKGERNNFEQLVSLPTYPDQEGLVILLNKNKVNDLFAYNEDFHSALITDEEGVSLERIDFNRDTNDPENWFSAASSEDYGTPGYLNSQSSRGTASSSNALTLDPKVIVPDGNGINDFVTIKYVLPKAGYSGSLRIYDVSGRQVKEIISNALLNQEGAFIWDGSDDSGTLTRIGYYIVYFEAFHPDGDLIKVKDKVVIGSNF